jgi:hypothetical protein
VDSSVILRIHFLFLSQAVENEQYDRSPDEGKGYRICLREGFVIDKHADKQLERRINIVGRQDI